MKFKVLILAVSALFLLQSFSPWEGAAGVAPAGELPVTGFFISTNSFPRNTVVDVTNLETGRTTRAIVANTLSNPGLLAVVSRDVADLIGMRQGSISRIRIISPSDPIAYQRFQEGLANEIPPFDSGTVLKNENELLADVYGRDTFRPGTQTTQAPVEREFTGPSYLMEPEWGGGTRLEIVDVPRFQETPPPVEQLPPANIPTQAAETKPIPAPPPSQPAPTSIPSPPPSQPPVIEYQEDVVKDVPSYLVERTQSATDKIADGFNPEAAISEAAKSVPAYSSDTAPANAAKKLPQYSLESIYSEIAKNVEGFVTNDDRLGETAKDVPRHTSDRNDRTSVAKDSPAFIPDTLGNRIAKDVPIYSPETPFNEIAKKLDGYNAEGANNGIVKDPSGFILEQGLSDAAKDVERFRAGQTNDEIAKDVQGFNREQTPEQIAKAAEGFTPERWPDAIAKKVPGFEKERGIEEVAKDVERFLASQTNEEIAKLTDGFHSERAPDELAKNVGRFNAETGAAALAKDVGRYNSETGAAELAKDVGRFNSEREADELAKNVNRFLPESTIEEVAKAIEGFMMEGSADELVKAVDGFKREGSADELAKAVGGFAAEKSANDIVKSVSHFIDAAPIPEPGRALTIVPAEGRSPESAADKRIYGIDPNDIIPGIAYPIQPERDNAREIPESRETRLTQIQPAAAQTAFSIRSISALDRGQYYVQLASIPSSMVESTIRQFDPQFFSYNPVVFRESDNSCRIMIGPLNQGESAAILARFKSIGYRDAFVRRGG